MVHTPGHAANHLCLILEEDGLLFSGDHILSGSTTIIDPPDGDMLRSHIYELRQSVDAAYPAKLIHTLPRVGYRLAETAESRDGE